MQRTTGRGRATRGLFLLLLSGVVGCGAGTSGPDVEDGPERLAPSVERGSTAFRAECASCHASRDGFDLAFFAYPDTTIIRRALAHVDRPTADDIVAYIRSLTVSPASRHFRPFQPSGTVLEDDREFAIRLFGEDRWPLDLTPEELLAMRPGSVPIGLPLLEWSVEANEIDWMPDAPLPRQLLDAAGGAVRQALDRYYDDRSMASLLEAIERFQAQTRGDTLSNRVCAGFVAFHTRAAECFDARRWMASLAGQHLLREGIETDIPLPILDLWWDVGEAAVSQTFDRLGDPDGRALARLSASVWLYLAWRFDPLRAGDNPLYFAEQLKHAGFRRLAVYTQLYSMVLDPDGWNGARPYIFHLQVYHRAPAHWQYETVLWGLRVLEGYQLEGIMPQPGTGTEEALSSLEVARRIIQNGPGVTLTPGQQATLLELVDRLMARIEA